MWHIQGFLQVFINALIYSRFFKINTLNYSTIFPISGKLTGSQRRITKKSTAAHASSAGFREYGCRMSVTGLTLDAALQTWSEAVLIRY